MISSDTVGQDSEYKTGYGYDYLQDIASYTGWTYKYVYGEWSELFELLSEGELDILCGVSYSFARSTQMYFSQKPMGTEGYYICVKGDNDDITADNIKSFSTLSLPAFIPIFLLSKLFILSAVISSLSPFTYI